MGVETNHTEYRNHSPSWERCQDAVDGSDAIKGKTTKYLPKLPAMDAVSGGDTLYNLYLDNALWYPGTGRTFDAYLGTMFRKPSTKEVPPGMDAVDEVFTAQGQTIDGFALELAGDVIKGYRPGILVDYPDIESGGISVADLEAIGGRPYASLYPAINILNWESTLRSGVLVTTLVTLEERVVMGKAAGKYGVKDIVTEDGYAIFRRVLSLDAFYTQELYIKTETSRKDEEYTLVSTKTPLMNGAPMNFIPFIPVTQMGLIWALSSPLINDIAVLNISDYRNEALYRDALLFNGRPTPCVSGLIMDSPNQKSVTLGSSSILQFETDGKWGTLGGGADAVGLKDAGNDLKQKMALVGSRALAEDPRGVEAAETASIHRQGEDGILSSIAHAVSAGMTRAMQIMQDWMPNSDGDVSYSVNTDFLPGDVDPARMTAMWTMLQAGDISFETFYAYLERGEVYPVGRTIEEEITAIEEDLAKEGENLPIGAEGLPTEEAVQAATLSGIQISSANVIIQNVANGILTREAAINQLVVFLGLTKEQAESVMVGVEEGQKVEGATAPSA